MKILAISKSLFTILSFYTKCIACLVEIISEKCGLTVFQNFCYLLLNWFYRSSRSQIFFKIGVLINFANFTGNHVKFKNFLKTLVFLHLWRLLLYLYERRFSWSCVNTWTNSFLVNYKWLLHQRFYLFRNLLWGLPLSVMTLFSSLAMKPSWLRYIRIKITTKLKTN